ncbi:PBECR2 nuclease fold domain-containing protein [Treponema pedis]|uniref:PBECR2 nuclease fold domain-containing protein n=1 Tax=Treponema pedis TaxID=409322 RepID=UPI00040FE29E|nr:PBECR2 nuclease fold domain-containing protein [Treponema pedis]
MGEHQFEKLQSLNRNYLLGAVAETLKKPVAVIFEMRDGKPSLLYVKSFLTGGKYKIVQSVVVEIDGVNVSVSTHERTINNVLNKIKKADQVIYKDTNSQPND